MESESRTLEVFPHRVYCYPSPVKTLAHLTGYIRPRERIYNEVAVVCEHLYKELGESSRETSRVRLQSSIATGAQIPTIALGVGDLEEIWGNRTLIALTKLRGYLVATGS